MFASPSWFGWSGNAAEVGTIPLTQATPGGLHASCPMLEFQVSTKVAPLAAAVCASTLLRCCSSQLKYLMSPAVTGTSGQQLVPLVGQPVGVADDQDLGALRAGVDALDDACHLRSGRVDRRDVRVASARVVVVLARGSGWTGGVELGALLGHADQAGVVAADAHGDERVARAERVELRRVGLKAVEILGLRHVAVVALEQLASVKLEGVDRAGDVGRIVVRRASAQDRVAGRGGDERGGGIGVAQRDVRAGRRPPARRWRVRP